MSDWSQQGQAAARNAENGLHKGAEAVRSSADSVRSSARGAAKAVNDAASQAFSRSNDVVRAGADQVGATASYLAEQIRGQPVAAAALCLGLGVFAGMILARRR